MTDMEFYKPVNKNTYVIYSKSGCPYCTKSKNLLKNDNYEYINCDEYLLENKSKFLFFIREHSNVELKMFPIIFYDGKYVNTLSEAEKIIEKQISFDNSELNF